MLVAVTGAAGFIGRHLCVQLAASGHRVRALVRRPAGGWPAGVDEVVVPDLLHGDALERALAGCDAVAHLAGRAHVLRERARDPAAEFWRANVDVTRRALDAADTAGARVFLLMSSVAAIASPDADVVDGAAPPRPATPYGASKRAAEEFVRRGAAPRGLRAPILRPPMVYGPGMQGNPLRLFRLVDRGLPLPLGSVRNRRSMLYVGNLVSAAVAALESPAADGTYAVTDGAPLSTPDFVRRAARALGRPARLVAVPPALLRGAGAAGDRLARLVPVPVTRATLESLLGSLVLDDAPFRAATGWRPRHTVDDALRHTAAWYRATVGAAPAHGGRDGAGRAVTA